MKNCEFGDWWGGLRNTMMMGSILLGYGCAPRADVGWNVTEELIRPSATPKVELTSEFVDRMKATPEFEGLRSSYHYWIPGESIGYFDPDNGILVGPPPSASADSSGYHGGCETRSCYLAPDGKWYVVGDSLLDSDD